MPAAAAGKRCRLKLRGGRRWPGGAELTAPKHQLAYPAPAAGQRTSAKATTPPRHRATGVTAAEALCIGDELRDLEAARKVGIAFGAVSWGYTAADALAAQKPAFVFKQVSDIAEALCA